MTGLRMQVMKEDSGFNDADINAALGRMLVKQQIPNRTAERILKAIVKEELSGLNLRKKDKAVLCQIGKRKIARASHFREYGFKTLQDFSSNYLSRLYRLNLLMRTQEGRSVAYKLRGLSSLAAEYGLLGG